MTGRRDEEELYDLYLDACAKGDAVEPAEFCARHGLGDDLPPWLLGLHRMMLDAAIDSPPSDDTRAPRPVLRAEEGLPFERLGEFRLLRRIGHGGMGAVYLAEQESLGRLVALKVLHGELHHSPTASERFRREARAIARLRHDNIVRVLGVGEHDGTRFFAMELAPGLSLADVLASPDGRPGTARVLRWGRSVARALAHAHREGVIHRDVKPANIRITPDDEAMLVDFGVARDEQAAGATLTQMFTGSPLYAAPEQLRGEDVDGRADIYALGVTLYECIAGRVPYSGDNVEQVVARILRGDVTPPRRLAPTISADLETVLLKAIAREPIDRYPSANALADDLDALLELRPVSARPPAWPRRLRMAAGRRPATTAVLVTLVAVLAFAGIWSGMRERNQARETVAEAWREVEHYRQTRARTRELEGEVAKLQGAIHAQYMTEEQDRLLATKEHEFAQLRRQREEDFYAVLDLLRQAQALDPHVDGLKGARAALFAEKWDEAGVLGDRVGQAFYEARIRGLGVNQPLGGRLGGKITLRFRSDPPGADVYLFLYRELAELVADGEHRMVAVPWSGRKTTIHPGRWALRVVDPAGDLEWGDLVLSIAGHTVRECMLANADGEKVRRGDRLVSVDGLPVRDPWDLESLADGDHTFVFTRGGER
ncbi:MAG: protein kinase domain-containing protein, partial [Planctomycetota bacterium]